MANGLFLLFVILVFVAFFLVVERILALTVGPQRAEARRVKERLRYIAESQRLGNAAPLLREAGAGHRSRLESWPVIAGFNQKLRGAGYKLSAGRAIAISMALGIGGFAVGWLLVNPYIAVIAGVLFAAVLPIKVSFDHKKRTQKFEEGLVEALDVMTRALKAGQPFNEAMLMVAQELHGPVAKEFGLTFAELNYGISPHEAFGHMLERVPSITLQALVVAVLLQRETGGNLAELLQKINEVLRGRFRFQRKVRTLSAEGRLSAVILTAVPFVLFGAIWLTTPHYVASLVSNSTGHIMIGGALILMVIGFFWVRKLVRIEV